MSITVQCPNCDKKLKAKDELAGKRIKCPNCQEPLSVPGSHSSIEPPLTRQEDSTATVMPPPSDPSCSTRTVRAAVVEPTHPIDSEAGMGELVGTYPTNPQDAWQRIADCVRGNSAYEMIRDDPEKREVIFRMRAGGLVVTASLFGNEGRTDLRMAFDDREASAEKLTELGKALPIFKHLPPVEAGKRVAEAGAKAVLTTALDSRTDQAGNKHGGIALSADSRFGSVVLIALGILAVAVNLVLLVATNHFFGVILAVCPVLFLVGFAGLIKPEVASFLLCEMNLAVPPTGGFSKSVKGVYLTLLFVGMAIGLLIVVAAMSP